MKLTLLSLLLLAGINLVAQPSASPADKVIQALELKENAGKSSLVKNIKFTNIGPTVMSGRVTDIDANPAKPHEFYVAYASGGLWYTVNNGASFEPILDNSATQNVGDIAVDWNNGTIWVGTGENNSSRSSYAGIGLLKSTDKGETWTHMGLSDSHHIGRILINPNNPDEVVVGVTGHLYSPNEERGIYKTVDGGISWRKTLFISENTGIIDVARAPGNYSVMYAAAWQKDRKAWNFTGNGSESGIYKSTDAGDSWELVSTEGSGFPTGEGVGRIGFAVYDENVVYAVHDNQFRRDKKADASPRAGLNKDDFKDMAAADFLDLDDKKLQTFLSRNRFPKKYTAEKVKSMVRSQEIMPDALAKYLENANSLLFDTPVIGAEVYKSTDGGASWKRTHENYIDDLYYSYGYYFGQINVDPGNQDKIYLGGVPLIKSDDGGKTFTSINGDNVHADHHSLWINPAMSGHLINGNDGGINISYDDGANWSKHNSPSVGQFYDIHVDNEDPYNVYGGLQDNGVWKGPHDAEESSDWHGTGKYPWLRIMGGDGMQTQVDSRNSNIVYTGFQFGNYFRLDLEAKSNTRIQPKHDLGENPYRFNWQTPILLSPHNQDILYFGSNHLHRTLNKGDVWETISPDLTHGGIKGNVAYGTLTTISESEFAFGLLYAGTDDGRVQLSKNAGGSWEDISTSLPQDMWVSRVQASTHKKERVYATLNGYRWDDFSPYVYMSDDFGQAWVEIGNELPMSPVNAFVEDPYNENLLFVGTDNGLYASFDRGASWNLFQNGIPEVAIHDLVIQPDAKHLLVGTHGRSIYKADIAKLEKMSPQVFSSPLYVFDVDNIKHSTRWGNTFWSWGEPSTPGLDVTFYSKNGGSHEFKVKTSNGVVVSETQMDADKGLNIISYDVAFSKEGKMAYRKKVKKDMKAASDGKTYLPKGEYTIQISTKNVEESLTFSIE
ncbi:MAG: glycosyl hydrolase [Bacteroidia bacterium]|nr:glycosyl hydrolase [Bacteroidia bacterium]